MERIVESVGLHMRLKHARVGARRTACTADLRCPARPGLARSSPVGALSQGDGAEVPDQSSSASRATERLTADTIAFNDARVMELSMPTPQSTLPSIAHSR